ncbi:hypothetical protein LAZ40_11005 [Cereibacter sphaeroides]|uniref:hypothetical protein n=1 Tax=Cereibacter sphaeroides TaxID=1063 RepID=UPI001F311BD5|nr:hypothetical protein [Cereibacter sphaeroides]MCE6959584.1 hypothetical protein [Cereibacter sphaeroides]MCE6974556.1 hypothetical protein [Cereibacter sphaeroides]
METRPITNPRKGMIVFNETMRLAATIREVHDDGGFDFHVHNGEWIGTYRAGAIQHLITGDPTVGCGTFAEITSITRAEADFWYLSQEAGVAHLLKGAPASGGSRLEQIMREKDLDPRDIAEISLKLIEERNLSGVLADRLSSIPSKVVKRDPEDEEPAYSW